MTERRSAVALCNYRYFLSGGPERYMFAVEALLAGRGHKVVPFAARYPQNRATPYAEYFVSSPATEGTVYFHEHVRSPRNVLRLLTRCFYSHEAKSKLQRLILDEGVDVVYVLQHLNVLSPSIIAGAKELGRRVVVRLSDFSLLCPAYHFLKKGQPCEACLGGLWRALPGRCTKGSLAATLTRVSSMYFHRIGGFYEHVDAFVAPTDFLRRKMIEGGLSADRIHHIPTFIEASGDASPNGSPKHILYAGRLSPEKGVDHLLRAYHALGSGRPPLLIAGDGPVDEVRRLRRLAVTLGLDGVEFRGFEPASEVQRMITDAWFLVVPSICYENLPNVVLEAFGRGRPVIASRIGSLPEVVQDGVTGLLFQPANVADLAAKMDALLSNPSLVGTLGRNAAHTAQTRFGADMHYRRLAEILC
jgi:glycosyltransferase involved in cell wall biosynthesis